MTKAFIEIPAWSTHKYELDKDTGLLYLDRVLNQHVPANYGFIQDTLAEDGDPLDIFVVSGTPLLPGSVCKTRVHGVMLCDDNGVSDNKIIATLPDTRLDVDSMCGIIRYLETYKSGFKYLRFSDTEAAEQEIQKAKSKYVIKI